MAKTKKVRKKKLSEIPTEKLVDDLAQDPKPNLLEVGEDDETGDGDNESFSTFSV